MPGARNEADEWRLVNQLVSQMKQQSGPSTADANKLASFHQDKRFGQQKSRESQMKQERLLTSVKTTNVNNSPDIDINDQSLRHSIDSSIVNSSVERLGSIVGSYEKPKGMDALRRSLLEEKDAYEPKSSKKF